MKGISRKPSSDSKPKAARKPKGGRRQENAVLRYLRQTWAEVKKVHWPTRREATNLSVIVLTVTVAMSMFLGLIDWLSALFFSFLFDLTG